MHVGCFSIYTRILLFKRQWPKALKCKALKQLEDIFFCSSLWHLIKQFKHLIKAVCIIFVKNKFLLFHKDRYSHSLDVFKVDCRETNLVNREGKKEKRKKEKTAKPQADTSKARQQITKNMMNPLPT